MGKLFAGSARSCSAANEEHIPAGAALGHDAFYDEAIAERASDYGAGFSKSVGRGSSTGMPRVSQVPAAQRRWRSLGVDCTMKW